MNMCMQYDAECLRSYTQLVLLTMWCTVPTHSTDLLRSDIEQFGGGISESQGVVHGSLLSWSQVTGEIAGWYLRGGRRGES